MEKSLGEKICMYRKKTGLSQREFASQLVKRGVKVTNQAVSKWESGSSLPNAMQFLIICDILGVLDISGAFIGKSFDLLSGISEEGRQRVYEYANMLRDSGLYDDPDLTGPRGTRIRTLPVYDIDKAANQGQLLDLPNYDLVEVGSEVPLSANFGVRISGESMEPEFHDGQIVWIHQQPKLEHSEIGVFMYEGSSYFKRLRDRVGGMRLQCVDSNYPDIIVSNPEKLVALGKVAD